MRNFNNIYNLIKIYNNLEQLEFEYKNNYNNKVKVLLLIHLLDINFNGIYTL